MNTVPGPTALDSRSYVPLLDGLADAAWLAELTTGTVVAANAAAQVLFAGDAHELPGLSALELASSAEDLSWWEDARAGHLSPLLSDTVVTCADGRVLHVSRSIRPVCLSGTAGSPLAQATHALVALSDRTAEHASELRREELLAELQGTLEATADGILVTDLRGGIRSFNRRFADLWGMPISLLQQRDDAAVQAWMGRSLLNPAAYESRLRALAQATLIAATDRLELVSGQVLERVTRPLFNAGRPTGRVWSFRDLTERLADQQRIESLSLHDPLTGVANRRRLTDVVANAVMEAQRSGGSLALLVVDLDRFRHVNDSLGHEMGDRVLLDVAQRIQGCLRQDDLLARLGGDQFAVVVAPADALAAEATARRVLNVDQAQVLNVDDASATVSLNRALLLRQFRLEPVAVRGGNEAQAAAAELAGLMPANDATVQRSAAASTPAAPHAPAQAQAPAAEPVAPPIAPGAMVIDKPLRSGQQVYARGRDLVVMAMVNPGAEVIADGHIHVYAPLRGKAIAGARGNTEARIFALSMDPELISIAGIYRTSDNPLPTAVLGKPAQVRLMSGPDGDKLVIDPLNP